MTMSTREGMKFLLWPEVVSLMYVALIPRFAFSRFSLGFYLWWHLCLVFVCGHVSEFLDDVMCVVLTAHMHDAGVHRVHTDTETSILTRPTPHLLKPSSLALLDRSTQWALELLKPQCD